MKHCLELARKGAGSVSPNPMVGACLVYNGQIIGEGYHQKYGEAHAEVNCINSVNAELQSFIKEAILYVSLEPCSHFGKTPPCVDFILLHQIKKVVVACVDLSSKVNGQGIEKLKEHGVEVIESVLEQEAIELNKRFFIFQKKQRPYIVLKWAESREGFIGNEFQQVKLTAHDTDMLTHQWRSDEDAIWVGFKTTKIDNPSLNVRHVKGNNPIRIVFDRNLELDARFKLLDNSQDTIVFNTLISAKEGRIQFVKIEESNFLKNTLAYLFQQQILSLLIEGGAQLIQKFVDENLWDEARVIKSQTSLAEGIGAPRLSNAIEYDRLAMEKDLVFFYKNSTLHA